MSAADTRGDIPAVGKDHALGAAAARHELALVRAPPVVVDVGPSAPSALRAPRGAGQAARGGGAFAPPACDTPKRLGAVPPSVMPGPFRGAGSTLAGRGMSGTAFPATRHRTASSRWYRPALERPGSSADPPTGGSTSGTDPQTRTGARDERVRSATPAPLAPAGRDW